MTDIKYNRVLIKISGEALAGKQGFGLDQETLISLANRIKEAHDLGVEIAIVVGAGNFWRGRSGKGMDRTTADHMGMVATVINSLALQDAFENVGVSTRVQTAIDMRRIAEPYIRLKAVKHLEEKRIVIFGCGTGNPFFSTDTAAALRAAEIDAEVILLAKNIDGIYDSDPKINKNAKKYDKITYMEILQKQLKAMDSTASSLCMENNIPSIAFALEEPDNIVKSIKGENVGTLITN